MVRELAAALDRDDFAAAAALIAEGCEYRIGGRVLRGPAEIVASYRASSQWARARLDGVAYESEVEPPCPSGIGVRFFDHLTVGGRRHTHVCRQVFTVGAEGRVTRIVHHDLPGEPESLRAFLEACGVEPA